MCRTLNFWPDKEQEAKEDQHRTIGNIDHIDQGVAFTHNFPHLVSIKYTGYPENDADYKTEKHQHNAGDCKDHSKYYPPESLARFKLH